VKTLLALLATLALLAVGLDLGAKWLVENRVEAAFTDDPRLDVESASFTIDSRPFLVDLLVSGEVSATLRLDGVVQRGVEVDAFELEVDGLQFDRASAFAGDVEVTDLDRATTTVTLDAGTIGDLVGVPVDIGADGTVTAGEVSATASLVDGSLVLEGGAIGTVTVPVPLTRFLPCEPSVEVADEAVVLTCVTDRLPPVVARVIGDADLRSRLGG